MDISGVSTYSFQQMMESMQGASESVQNLNKALSPGFIEFQKKARLKKAKEKKAKKLLKKRRK